MSRHAFAFAAVECQVRYLLHRIGFSPQMRARRATERDEKAIAASRTGTWAKVRG
jgi:putative transposase